MKRLLILMIAVLAILFTQTLPANAQVAQAIIDDLEPTLVGICYRTKPTRLVDRSQACKELAKAFWERQYLRKFGISLETLPSSPIPPLPVSTPNPDSYPPNPNPKQGDIRLPRPQPDPIPLSQLMDNTLMSELLSRSLGDPNPQPNIAQLLSSPAPRLEAAKQLLRKVEKALPELQQDIKQLEREIPKNKLYRDPKK